MSAQVLGALAPLKAAYILVFAGAALACFLSIRRMEQISDADTRRGLFWLLVTSGLWASAQVGFLVLPTADLKVGAYIFGLIVGLATVGPWLYFCSAYTGRSIHRSPTLQRVGIGVFLAISAVKLTNPFHQLYFTTSQATEPFVHLAVNNGLLHWLAMGLAYALAAVGYFMLLELFWRVGQNARPLLILVALTGLPVVLDVVGLVTPYLVDISYEPLGVAAFAVGMSLLYFEEFRTVQLAAESDDPVIILDDEDRVRDFNPEAAAVFSGVESGIGIDQVLPEIPPETADADSTIEIDRGGETRYYEVSSNPFSTDRARLGRVLTLSDITERKRNREELERQNERLEAFASVVSHDLRNPLNVASGRLELAREEHDSEHLASVAEAHERMTTLIEDILTLARQGQPIDEFDVVSLKSLAEKSWGVVETADADLTVTSDLEFMADEERVRQLMENLFRNAVEHGGSEVHVTVGPLTNGNGFYIADDGVGIPKSDRDSVLQSGFTTAADGTGFGLGIVSEIVEAHGWTITVGESVDGGARFEIRNVDLPATAGV